MLVALANTPRDYAWGSVDLIADLQGRTPSGRPEAEVWFGDHPASPAIVQDGTARTLDRWLADTRQPRLPFLVKLLAAGSPLSIQAHPSKAQAEAGHAREDRAGVPRDATSRNYRDDNHKPEVIVAVSDRFDALAGLRDLAATQRLLADLGDGAGPAALADRLRGGDLAETVSWLLSGDAQAEVDGIVAAIQVADSREFPAEIEALRRIAEAYPGDPGVAVALLLNHVSLRRGEAIFVRAGVLHAYLGGLGVEVMAASDNVLRGGLTPKHIDVPELVAVIEGSPEPVPRLKPESMTPGVARFAPPVADFVLVRAVSRGDEPTTVPIAGTAVVVAVGGSVEVTAGTSGEVLLLTPGSALVASEGEGSLSFTGIGEVFVATRGGRDTPL